MILLTVFIEDGSDEETKERRQWCDEYYPHLTFYGMLTGSGLVMQQHALTPRSRTGARVDP